MFGRHDVTEPCCPEVDWPPSDGFDDSVDFDIDLDVEAVQASERESPDA